MKILMATHYFASHQGGIEIVAGQLFHQLSELDQEIVWIATDATPPPQVSRTARVEGLRACNFVEQKIGLPFPIPTFASVMKVRHEVARADVVIVHDCLYLTNIAAYLFARCARVPVIVIQHIGHVPYSSRILSSLMKFANAVIARNMLRGAQQVVFISETTKRYFSQLRFRTPAALIFNGVDASVFRPLHRGEDNTALRQKFGLPLNRPVVLFVGRFVEKKGLSVMKRLVEAGSDYAWAFAGWGPLDPRAWNAANVHVFSDLHGPSLAELYQASDLLVLPSAGEGFPLVIQEALACALPVVCSSETANADPALAGIVSGVDLQPGDDEASARHFLVAIQGQMSASASPDHREQRRNFAVRRYSWRTAAEHYLAIAANLTAGARSVEPALAETPASRDSGAHLGPREASL